MAQLLVGVNVIVFAICWSQSGTANIATDILLRYGAMYSQALERHEYWRLVGYGFCTPIRCISLQICFA
jgi:rhomboid protease GluP